MNKGWKMSEEQKAKIAAKQRESWSSGKRKPMGSLPEEVRAKISDASLRAWRRRKRNRAALLARNEAVSKGAKLKWESGTRKPRPHELRAAVRRVRKNSTDE